MEIRQNRERQNELLQLQGQRIQREAEIRQEAKRLLQQQDILDLAEKTNADTPELLRQKLHKGQPLMRLFAILVVSRRRLPLHKELIEALNDPNQTIRQSAHSALVRLSRGTDFGPPRSASQRGIERSIEKWRNWLVLQKDSATAPLEKVAVDGKPPRDGLRNPVKLLLDHGNHELHTTRPEVVRLCDELVHAKADKQKSILARLRDAQGVDNTDALALAIPKLPDSLRAEAENALAVRLTHMRLDSLRDKLQDDQLEVRRAAAFACARKLAKQLIPDLVQLLDDPEKDVIQAAREALIELTGEDFGPAKNADRRGHADALTAWRKWCKEHPAAPK